MKQELNDKTEDVVDQLHLFAAPTLKIYIMKTRKEKKGIQSYLNATSCKTSLCQVYIQFMVRYYHEG